jgi:hypothetical protein
MLAQMRWYEILKPFRSMLKFRLPYIGDKLDRKVKLSYLEGDIFFQIWPAGSSSECRLVVKENASKNKIYDSIKYENQLFRFNQVERVMCYEHDVKVEGLDHCYDCRAEVFVFDEYLKIKERLRKLSKNKIEMFQTVEEYIKDLNNILDANTKKIRITKDGKHYDLKFTDVEYGKSSNEICNKSSQVYTKRKTYFDKNNRYQKAKNMNTSQVHDIKNRLGPKNVKRLKHGRWEEK